MPIWGNSLICIKNRPIWHKQILESNIDKILVVVDLQEKRFLNRKEIYDMCGVKLDFLLYCGIIAAIPSRWKCTIKTDNVLGPIDQDTKMEILAKSSTVTKKVYWDLIESQYPSDANIWFRWATELRVDMSEEEWWLLFPNFLKQIIPTKLRYFQYRILTKTLVTNVKRSHWDQNISPLCSLCHLTNETMLHLIVYCPLVAKLWKQLEKWIKYFLKIDFALTPAIIILNNYTGKERKLVNMMIVILKTTRIRGQMSRYCTNIHRFCS